MQSSTAKKNLVNTLAILAGFCGIAAERKRINDEYDAAKADVLPILKGMGGVADLPEGKLTFVETERKNGIAVTKDTPKELGLTAGAVLNMCKIDPKRVETMLAAGNITPVQAELLLGPPTKSESVRYTAKY